MGWMWTYTSAAVQMAAGSQGGDECGKMAILVKSSNQMVYTKPASLPMLVLPATLYTCSSRPGTASPSCPSSQSVIHLIGPTRSYRDLILAMKSTSRGYSCRSNSDNCITVHLRTSTTLPTRTASARAQRPLGLAH